MEKNGVGPSTHPLVQPLSVHWDSELQAREGSWESWGCSVGVFLLRDSLLSG